MTLETARDISLFLIGPGGQAIHRDIAARRAEIHAKVAELVLDPGFSLDGGRDEIEVFRKEVQHLNYLCDFLERHAATPEIGTPEAGAALA